MKLNFKHSRSTTAVILALTLSSCANFEERMQANGSFDYQEAVLSTAYQTGDFTTDEARDAFEIPPLTEAHKQVGFSTTDVDVRPPVQLIPVIDGVLLEKNTDKNTKVWFNAFSQSEDMQAKVWYLLKSYLAKFNTQFVSIDESRQEIVTRPITNETIIGTLFNDHSIVEETSYKFSLEEQEDGHSVALIIDALSYRERNDGVDLKVNLAGSRKHDIEVRFVNSLLAYAYQVKQSQQLGYADAQPLTIKLGFDDNHKSTWLVDSEFEETWSKLPRLLSLLSFEIIKDDKNLGYFLLNYKKPTPDYWPENNLQPFDLIPNEYYIQLGEVTGGVTSISWLDEDKKPLSDQKITEIYLSITNHIRGALIENDRQTKEF